MITVINNLLLISYKGVQKQKMETCTDQWTSARRYCLYR